MPGTALATPTLVSCHVRDVGLWCLRPLPVLFPAGAGGGSEIDGAGHGAHPHVLRRRGGHRAGRIGLGRRRVRGQRCRASTGASGQPGPGDCLRRQLRLGHGDPDPDRHAHRAQAHQGRERPPRDRHHPDGKTAYVANYLSDSVITIGPPPTPRSRRSRSGTVRGLSRSPRRQDGLRRRQRREPRSPDRHRHQHRAHAHRGREQTQRDRDYPRREDRLRHRRRGRGPDRHGHQQRAPPITVFRYPWAIAITRTAEPPTSSTTTPRAA
jgi:hypothetical protein